MNLLENNGCGGEYKLANGMSVYPEAIEDEIKILRYIRNAMLYGDGRDYNVAIVVPDFTALQSDPRIKPLLKDTLAESLNNEVLRYFLSNQIIVHLCKTFGWYVVPRKYLFIAEDFVVDKAQPIRPMRSIRPVVMKKYGEQLLALYK